MRNNREYLSKYDILGHTINLCREEIEKLEADIEFISPRSFEEKTQSTKGGSVVSSLVERLDQENRKLTSIIDLSLDIREGIISAIDAMEDERYKNILFGKYVRGKTLEQLSEEFNYSYRQILRLHDEALNRILLEDVT